MEPDDRAPAADPISHSRIWKAQLHYLARHHRVVAYDGRGNGNSDSPDPSGPWLDGWCASDCLAVMDATSTEAAVLAGICGDGVWPSVQLAGAHPERVLGIVALAPGVPLITPPHPFKAAALERWDEELDRPEGWEKFNRHYIRGDQRGFLEFFFGEMFPEPLLDQARRGRRRLRARRPGREAGHGRRRAGRRDQGGGRAGLPAGALPGARRPRRSRQLPAV